MNICLISSEYPPETGWGGIGTYIYILAHGLVELGHSVHVICRATNSEQDYQDQQVWVHRILSLPSKRHTIYRKYLAEILYVLEYSQRVFHKFREVMDDVKIDIVEVPEYGVEGYYLIRNAQVPIVIKLHTPLFLLRKVNKEMLYFNRFWVEKLEKLTILNSKVITSCSASLASIVARRFKIPTSQIEVIPNPMDTDTFIPDNDEVDENLVIYSGRLEYRKGVHTLTKAIPIILDRIPSLKFTFVGHNYTAPQQCAIKEELINILKRKDALEKVEFLDRISRDELIKYYKKAAICVVPSIWENFPYACLEPMSLAKPMVSSRIGGIPEIIEDGISGLLFTPDDEKDLASKVISLIENPDEMKRLGKNARERIVSAFSKQAIAQKTAKFYEQVLRGDK